MQAANSGRKKTPFTVCIFCDSEQSLPAGVQPASDHARTAEALLRMQHGVELLITEAKVLNGRHGPFDFSVLLCCPHSSAERRRLEVEVDGQQHFVSGMHGITPHNQRAVDERKDSAAWQQGRMLLRLHHADKRFWAQKIEQAVRRATFPARNRFLFYTPSYGRRDKVSAVQA